MFVVYVLGKSIIAEKYEKKRCISKLERNAHKKPHPNQ
jgi:hypothetical protein